MLSKYEILVNILDCICNNSPEKFASYKLKGKKTEEINNQRALAYIHLFLLVKFGVQDFAERHDNYITDGSYDGGIDAYYIDKDTKTVYLIQSKFRVNEKNYETVDISPDEIAVMEIDRILQGEDKDSQGNTFNGKIKSFQKKYQGLEGVGRYSHKVILLANLTHSTNKKSIKAILKDYEFEVFDYERSYNELVFPYCTSTYFTKGDIIIDENIDGIVEACDTNFNKTSYDKCTVSLLFVPAKFVAQMVETYRNSILCFNPRNYLSMNNNDVNKSISKSVENEYDDFALMNNGITIICTKFDCSTKNGLKDSTNIYMENPQIINGGQTAYTLSRMLFDKENEQIKNKKVLLKVISTFRDDKIDNCKSDEEREHLTQQYYEFIEKISNAANYQTRIDEPDRRANMPIQKKFQEDLYKKYGVFYNRKQGEFEEAIYKKVIKKNQIVDRQLLFKTICAINGNCNEAMNESKDVFFSEKYVVEIMNQNITPIHLAMYSYLLYKNAKSLENKNKKNPESSWGKGITYGKFAIVSAAGLCLKKHDISGYNLEQMNEFAAKSLYAILDYWSDFEQRAIKKEKNRMYFNHDNMNYLNYYKNANSKIDVEEFWSEYDIDEMIN